LYGLVKWGLTHSINYNLIYYCHKKTNNALKILQIVVNNVSSLFNSQNYVQIAFKKCQTGSSIREAARWYNYPYGISHRIFLDY